MGDSQSKMCRGPMLVPTAGIFLSMGMALTAAAIHEESAYSLDLNAWGYALLPITLVIVFRVSLRRNVESRRLALLHPAIELVRHSRTHVVGNDPEVNRFRRDICRCLCALVTLMETSSAESHQYLSHGEIQMFRKYSRKHTLLVMWLGDTVCAVRHRVLSEATFGAMEAHVAALQKATLDADEVPAAVQEKHITGSVAWGMLTLRIVSIPWALAPLYGYKTLAVSPMVALTMWGTVAVVENFGVPGVPVDLLETFSNVCGMMLPEISLQAQHQEVNLVIAPDAPLPHHNLTATDPLVASQLTPRSHFTPQQPGSFAGTPRGTGGQLLMQRASERMEALIKAR